MDRFKKYEKYKDLMEKLKKALESEFYYEAIFIEYAIIEDRTQSLLRHAHLKLVNEKGDDLTLGEKLRTIKHNKIFKEEYIQKHITRELIQAIYNWKEDRNGLIHSLIDTQYSNETIKKVALDGSEIIKKLNNKSTLVNRHLDKELLEV